MRLLLGAVLAAALLVPATARAECGGSFSILKLRAGAEVALAPGCDDYTVEMAPARGTLQAGVYRAPTTFPAYDRIVLRTGSGKVIDTHVNVIDPVLNHAPECPETQALPIDIGGWTSPYCEDADGDELHFEILKAEDNWLEYEVTDTFGASDRTYVELFRFNPPPPKRVRRPRSTVAILNPTLGSVLEHGVVAAVDCACSFTVNARVGKRDSAAVASPQAGVVTIALDARQRALLRRAALPKLRIAVTPDGFARPSAVRWTSLPSER